MAKLQVYMVVLKKAGRVSIRKHTVLTYHTLRPDLGNHTSKQPCGSFLHFDLCTRSNTGAPVQVLLLWFSSLASHCPSFPPVTARHTKPSERKVERIQLTFRKHIHVYLWLTTNAWEFKKWERGGGGPLFIRIFWLSLARRRALGL